MDLVIVGGSDAGIAAALRARECDQSVAITVLVEDAYPNFSICGLPYYLSGDVEDWPRLAHRDRASLEALGIAIATDTVARSLDLTAHQVLATDARGMEVTFDYDRLVIATGALPVQPPIAGLTGLGPAHGVHLLHSIDDGRAVMESLTQRRVGHATVIGAGYIGLEMAEALRKRDIPVAQFEALPEVLPTLDVALARRVHDELVAHGVDLHTSTRVSALATAGSHIQVTAANVSEQWDAMTDLVLVVTGVMPSSELASRAGIATTPKGAIVVDEQMATSAPDVWAAGDCVRTRHPLLDWTYLPLGTTAHKQGRVAGENALGGERRFRGSLGTQVVKVFDLVAARTGLRDHEAAPGGFVPFTHDTVADDHKRYYPGASPVHVRITGDVTTGRLLGVQMVGTIASGVHKRIDTAAAAIFARLRVEELLDLDLSYTPPLGTPWDLLQTAAAEWLAAAKPS